MWNPLTGVRAQQPHWDRYLAGAPSAPRHTQDLWPLPPTPSDAGIQRHLCGPLPDEYLSETRPELVRGGVLRLSEVAELQLVDAFDGRTAVFADPWSLGSGEEVLAIRDGSPACSAMSGADLDPSFFLDQCDKLGET